MKMLQKEKGFIISLVSFFVITIAVVIILVMGSLMSYSQKISTNSVKSTQSYYAAESGVEDALLRLNNNPQLGAFSYSLTSGTATAAVDVSGTVGGSRTVSATGTNSSIVRTVQTVYSIDSTGVGFYYGVAVGAGGLQMSNGSEVLGNLFSAGNISGSGTIDNNVVISGNGHSITGVYVGGDVFAYSCLSSASVNNLTYVTGGTHTCTVRGTTSSQANEITDQPLPIPDSQITAWKNDAAANTTTGNVTINSNTSMGPRKIVGNLTINGNVTLTLTGTVYVTGTLTFQNNATVALDSSYGSTGGVILADGKTTLHNGDVFSGSGQAGSYVMVLSTSTDDLAIDVQNNATGVVLYASNGGITIHNNVSITEATGYKVIMQNNSKIQYSNGVANIYFSSGTGAKWKVTSWQEK